jgi:hypothetical protein
MLIFIMALFFDQDIQSVTKKEKEESIVLPFIKLEAIGTNPLNKEEKIIFRKNSAEKMVREFKETPVYLVTYKQNNNNKLESNYEQVGTASCIFISENWMTASIKTNKPLPKDYLLRARTVSNQNKIIDNTLEIYSASVIEFYLKPKDTATEFK